MWIILQNLDRTLFSEIFCKIHIFSWNDCWSKLLWHMFYVFLSYGFGYGRLWKLCLRSNTAAIIVNPSERKIVKCTSVHGGSFLDHAVNIMQDKKRLQKSRELLDSTCRTSFPNLILVLWRKHIINCQALEVDISYFILYHIFIKWKNLKLLGLEFWS